MKKIILIFIAIIPFFSCSVPQSKIIQRLFPYIDYQALRDTLWESIDRQVRIKFNSQVKSANLIYQGVQYHFVSYDYHEGVFTMGIAGKTGKNQSPSWRRLVLKPETKTFAYFDLIGDDEIIGGTLQQINIK